MKTILAEISETLGKTALVVLAIPLGFMVGSVLGLPNWAQVFGFVPAAVLFFHLSGEPAPPVKKWLSLLLGITLLNFIYLKTIPHLSESGKIVALVVFFGLVSWLQRFVFLSPARRVQEPSPDQ